MASERATFLRKAAEWLAATQPALAGHYVQSGGVQCMRLSASLWPPCYGCWAPLVPGCTLQLRSGSCTVRPKKRIRRMLRREQRGELSKFETGFLRHWRRKAERLTMRCLVCGYRRRPKTATKPKKEPRKARKKPTKAAVRKKLAMRRPGKALQTLLEASKQRQPKQSSLLGFLDALSRN